jgi:hypothetical protein
MDDVGEGVNDGDYAYEAVAAATAACVQVEVMMVTVCVRTIAVNVKGEASPSLEGTITEKEVEIHCRDRPPLSADAAAPPLQKEAHQD